VEIYSTAIKHDVSPPPVLGPGWAQLMPVLPAAPRMPPAAQLYTQAMTRT